MADHDIEILREMGVVIIRIPTDIKCSDTGCYYIDFKCPEESIFYAELKLRYLRKRHHDKIKAIRKAEFLSGWKHAKAKKHGKSYFTCFWCSLKEMASYRF